MGLTLSPEKHLLEVSKLKQRVSLCGYTEDYFIKRPMGHIAHLMNSLNQSAQLRKAMIKLIKRKKNLLFKK